MAKIKLRIFSAIAQRIKAETFIELEANTIKDLISKLKEKYGENFSKLILDENDRLKPNIGIIVNGKNIQALEGFETKLNEGDEVNILPIIAGG